MYGLIGRAVVVYAVSMATMGLIVLGTANTRKAVDKIRGLINQARGTQSHEDEATLAAQARSSKMQAATLEAEKAVKKFAEHV